LVAKLESILKMGVVYVKPSIQVLAVRTLAESCIWLCMVRGGSSQIPKEATYFLWMFALKVVSTPASENEVRFIYPVAFLNFRILEFWGFQGFWRVEGLSWV
jgi:hypothetical protein